MLLVKLIASLAVHFLLNSFSFFEEIWISSLHNLDLMIFQYFLIIFIDLIRHHLVHQKNLNYLFLIFYQYYLFLNLLHSILYQKLKLINQSSIVNHFILLTLLLIRLSTITLRSLHFLELNLQHQSSLSKTQYLKRSQTY